MTTWRQRLARALASAAARRLRRRHPDWASALLSEQESLAPKDGELGWAWGALWASCRMDGAPYAPLLTTAVATLVAYQWTSDESVVTAGLVLALALLVSVLQPSRSLVSAAAIGSVVAAVNAFETASGLRPAYELHLSSWAHDAVWLCFLAPALVGSLVGRRLGRPSV